MPRRISRRRTRRTASLYLEDVTVSFDGFKRAQQPVARPSTPGELRCIIGPNGAGKTTMMDVITGKTRPDAGTVFFGSTIDLHAPRRGRRSRSSASAASSRSRRSSSSTPCSRTSSSR
jgi:ABC-type uncharacterized transport system ATPase subunit